MSPPLLDAIPLMTGGPPNRPPRLGARCRRTSLVEVPPAAAGGRQAEASARRAAEEGLGQHGRWWRERGWRRGRHDGGHHYCAESSPARSTLASKSKLLWTEPRFRLCRRRVVDPRGRGVRVVALAAPAPGLCADFGELGELELLRRLHPHKSVRAYSLNAPEAVVSAASQVSCDVVYVDLSSEHDHTSSKTARYFAKAANLFRNNASQLWLPRRVAVRPGIDWAKLEPRAGREANCINYAELRDGVLYPHAGRAGACASVAAPSWLRGGLDAYVYTGVAAVEPPPKQTSQPPASPSVKTARFVMVACDAASDPRRATEALVAMASAVASASPCLLYTSPSPRDRTRSRMPSSA